MGESKEMEFCLQEGHRFLHKQQRKYEILRGPDEPPYKARRHSAGLLYLSSPSPDVLNNSFCITCTTSVSVFESSSIKIWGFFNIPVFTCKEGNC
ncbi:unnamed protein product [Citrullus colocynthis]|uniref:Uncharacterized protein n=1 Tax=Citrullus colocynthis TaxID=252529 RepID=A0ABP0YMV3_9ROSI